MQKTTAVPSITSKTLERTIPNAAKVHLSCRHVLRGEKVPFLSHMAGKIVNGAMPGVSGPSAGWDVLKNMTAVLESRDVQGEVLALHVGVTIMFQSLKIHGSSSTKSLA